jgi:hypothetical protein
MKPTAPPRTAFRVFATTPCRGLSLSRWTLNLDTSREILDIVLRNTGRRNYRDTIGRPSARRADACPWEPRGRTFIAHE